ncbi:hypothetical protein QWY84_09875 [Aquisalimonas lutea]|nr:hypothetical protein [Aquisalimonas lutea]MDN3517919.1 hypothetical protein [Aquisalimonas lutea]
MTGKGALRVLVAAFALAFAGSVAAQSSQGQGQGQGQGQDSNPQMRLQQIQQRLAEAQQKALDENPGLQSQREELEELVIQKMEEEGYDPNANMETLENAQSQIQNEDLSNEERQQMLQDARQAQQQLQEAQQAAMQDEEVVEAQEAFQNDLMEAMREQDPETDQLIEEFRSIQQEMRGRMGQGQGGAPGQGGGGAQQQ